MQCTDCGVEMKKGTYYCPGCGKPVGFPTRTGTMTEEPDLNEIPGPPPPVERPPQSPPEAESARPRTTRALCSLCMGSFPETVMSRVDGNAYCPDCSPLTARRTGPPPARPVETHAEPRFEPPPRTVRLDAPSPSGGIAGKVIGALVVLALAGAGFGAWSLMNRGRIDRMLSGLDTAPRPGQLLCQKYTPGERLSYRVGLRVKGDAKASGAPLIGPGGGDASFDGGLTGKIRMDVLSVDDRGNAEVQILFSDLDITGKAVVDGQEIHAPPDLRQKLGALSTDPVVVKVDPFGRTLEYISGGEPGLEGFLSAQFAQPPEKHLTVGDQWTIRQPMDLPAGPMPFSLGSGGGLSATLEVVGYKTVNGRDCMVIEMEGGLDDGGGMKGPGFGLDVAADVKGALFFDSESGHLVKAAMDLRMDLSMEGGGQSATADFELEMDIDLE